MIIVRYLIRETLKAQISVFLVLFLIFVSQKFIAVLADASDGDIPSGLILTLVGLNMPTMAMLMLPLSLYIGILVTFGRLYAESEITVMNATGIGNKFLIRAAMYLAIITGAVAGFNSLWLAPWSQAQTAQVYQDVATDNTIELLQKGQFQRSPDGRAVVFIDDIDKKELKNVFIAQLTPQDSIRPSVMFAKSGTTHELSDGRQILKLQDGKRYEGIPTRLDYMVTDYQEYEALIGQKQGQAPDLGWMAKPTIELLGDDSRYAQAELQWRISLVICIPLLTMIVIPLSAVNPRQGRFAKMAPAVLIYLTYFLLLSTCQSAMQAGSLPTYIGMWALNGGTLLVGIAINSIDSLWFRRLKDKYRRKAA
ncbi:LPS export ABC transporter permease LptF [Vibrio sp. SCSIO 43136]|uniref:LPS export ABC transporter permease LptF n=1 Tax=Vibrio sp. SCSIO 43136 TaxID=2819101 RepID=UPI0020762471|nr:LPS export ABC transporter permease LptF [Vibrio sp. SCSIO 43136]USD65590.1 LPS export ABC transporter permease LptF [Vibrio sp. SCSIO 43136]